MEADINNYNMTLMNNIGRVFWKKVANVIMFSKM